MTTRAWRKHDDPSLEETRRPEPGGNTTTRAWRKHDDPSLDRSASGFTWGTGGKWEVTGSVTPSISTKSNPTSFSLERFQRTWNQRNCGRMRRVERL
ncbi:hypothetical protein EYF80_061002 [Liparis tanakae]|uniref:Uncharacterized protein n=1 Tax=Liparis tanakae TaxID=230148 RepID=A0A4Z2EJU5_9TELE|nr:hypothetical protein EYF80_061002 [Liparis tanakae]